jgi:hypothetical protein
VPLVAAQYEDFARVAEDDAAAAGGGSPLAVGADGDAGDGGPVAGAGLAEHGGHLAGPVAEGVGRQRLEAV